MHKVERLNRRGTVAQRTRRTAKRARRAAYVTGADWAQKKDKVHVWTWAGPKARQPDEKEVKEFVAAKAETFKGWGHAKLRLVLERMAANFRKAQLAAHIQRCPFTVAADPKRPNHRPGPCGGRMKRTAFTHAGALIPALECRTCGRLSVPSQLRPEVQTAAVAAEIVEQVEAASE